MILFIEVLIILASMTIVAPILARRKPLWGLYTMHPAIQRRVYSLPEYADAVKTPKSFGAHLLRRLPFYALMWAVLWAFVTLGGARSFSEAFLRSMIIWMAAVLYKVIILQCVLAAASEGRRIPGTEDMPEYADIGFYVEAIPRASVIGLAVSMLVGLFTMLIF